MATVQETIDSGITPIVIEIQEAHHFESREKLARTFLTINSLDLGVLTYRQYRFVARRTKQSAQLTDRHVQKLFRRLPELLEDRADISCYIIPVYARLVKDGELIDILLRAMSIYPDAYPGRVCIEISADILYEDIDGVKERINQLREMGFRIAISEVGDRFCPIFSLAEIPFDYAFLDQAVMAKLAEPDGDRVVGSIVNYLKSLDVKVFAPDVSDSELLFDLKRVGCDGYTKTWLDEAEEDETSTEEETTEEAPAEVEETLAEEEILVEMEEIPTEEIPAEEEAPIEAEEPVAEAEAMAEPTDDLIIEPVTVGEEINENGGGQIDE